MPDEKIVEETTEEVVTEDSTTSTEEEVPEVETSEETEDGAEAEAAEDESAETTDKKGSAPGAEKRIKGLIDDGRKKDEHIAYLEGLVEGKKPPAETTAPLTDVELASFDAFLQARPDAAYEDFVVAKAKHEIAKDNAVNTEAGRRGEVMSGYEGRVVEAQKAHDDWDAVAKTVNPVIVTNPAMRDAIIESEVGPEVQYHLGQNPAEATRIAQLNPISAVKEIGRIEEKIIASREAEPPKGKTISQAPGPLKTVDAKGKQAVDSSKLSMKDWVKRREKELADKRS